MSDKAKHPSFFGKLYSRLKTKLFGHPLTEWNLKNLKTILYNAWLRIVFLFLDLGLVISLLYLLSYTLNHVYPASLANQLFYLGFFVFLLFLPITYGWRSLTQILFEVSLNTSLFNVRADINRVRKKGNERDIRLLQIDINRVRTNLKDFIDVSAILSPPIYNYELDRVQKRIDIFFNSICKMLFPPKRLYSLAQEIEHQETLDYYESLEPTPAELEQEFEEMHKDETGEIYSFDREALDQFMTYLGDTLFEKTKPFSPISFKHPIDLIEISGFFESWNSVASRCDKVAFEEAQKDIDEYYASIRQERQRMRGLRDNVLVVVISVFLSVILSKLI
jgi:hypothetical protein